MPRLSTDTDLVALFQRIRTVAILGASPRRHRAGYYVPDYLNGQGYRVLAVNPTEVGSSLFGGPVRATLAELADLEDPVDVVDVFRRGEHLPGHLEDLLAMDPRPGCVWLQLGVHHPAFERAVLDAGLDLITDLCMLAEHRRLGLPPTRVR